MSQKTLTLEQFELLKEALDNYNDRGPEGYGFDSPKLAELKGIFYVATAVTIEYVSSDPLPEDE